MTPYDLQGPWTGATLRERPPLPWHIQRRRKRVRFVFVMLAITAGVFGILAAVWNMPVPQL